MLSAIYIIDLIILIRRIFIYEKVVTVIILVISSSGSATS